MKIIVTGRNGQLGSELYDILSSQPDKQCVFLDR